MGGTWAMVGDISKPLPTSAGTPQTGQAQFPFPTSAKQHQPRTPISTIDAHPSLPSSPTNQPTTQHHTPKGSLPRSLSLLLQLSLQLPAREPPCYPLLQLFRLSFLFPSRLAPRCEKLSLVTLAHSTSVHWDVETPMSPRICKSSALGRPLPLEGNPPSSKVASLWGCFRVSHGLAGLPGQDCRRNGERSVSTYASRRVMGVSSYDRNACSLQLSSSLVPHRGTGCIKGNRRRGRTDLTRPTCILFNHTRHR